MALEKNLKFYKQRFYLKKAVTFQRVLSQIHCGVTKHLLRLKIFTKPSKLKVKCMFIYLKNQPCY